MFKAFKRWRAARKVEDELFALTDRELNDLGISRYDIRRIARMAATDVI